MFIYSRKRIGIALILLVWLVAAHARVNAQVWPNSYSYARTITISHTQVPNTDQTSFPVLFSGTYSYLATTPNGGGVTDSNGYDIIFTSDVNGLNILPFERESYNGTTGAVNFWVQVPTVSHTSDTVIYLFYGNSSVTTDQSNEHGAWDSNYAGVWHLPNGSTLSANDSTSNGNNGTINGATATNGQIDGAANFSGGQVVSIAPNAQIQPSSMSLSFWLNRGSASQNTWGRILEKGTDQNGAPYGSYFVYFNNTDSSSIGLALGFTDKTSDGWTSATANIAANTWYYMTMTYDGSNVKVYENGVLEYSHANTRSIFYDSTPLAVGANNTNSGGFEEYLNGMLDELRLSKVARSADWIATEYNNQSSPSTFYSIGSATSYGGPNISSLSPSSGNIGDSVTITGINFGSSQGSSTVTFAGTVAAVTSWSSTQIVITVPSGAISGNVIVTVGTEPSNGAFFTISGGPWSNGYSHRRTVVIFHKEVPNTDQTNFPILFSGTYSYLATTGNGGGVTNANGYDIIFTSDSAGTNVLPYERESYNATTGSVVFWVQIPSLSHTTDTAIYLFYGNSSVATDQSNKTGVWDSNYKGVWHLPNGSTLSGGESSADGYTLTNNNSTTASSGEIDGAASFNGSNNYLSNSSLSISSGASITISFWNYVPSSNLQSASAFTIGGSDTPNRIQAHAPWSDRNLYWDYGTYTGGRASASYSSYLDSWAYVVLEYNSGTTTHSIYLNGSLAASSTNSTTPTATQTGIDIGAWPQASLYDHGTLDEFRVSTIARSADWIATEYNNQSSPAAFYDEGGPAILNLSPSSGLSGSSVTIAGRHFSSSQGTSTVSFNGITASVTTWSDTQIVAVVPPSATTGPVVVVVGGVASNSYIFTLLGISSINPSTAPANASVSLTGAGFGATQGSSTVQFNNVTASVSSWSNTSITVTVPSNATSGPVTVTVGGVTSNGVQFTAAGSFSITSISPTSAPLGASVTITGSAFGSTQGNSSVSFNTIDATVTSWSNTQIIAVVPLAASPGPVSVTVDNLTAQGPTFTPVVKASVTDSLGNTSSYAAAVNGGEWRVASGQGSGCSSCTVRGANNYAYDAYGNVTSLTDPNGNTSTYTYDSANNLSSETHPVDSTHNATTSYTRNSFGEPLTVTDALGNITTNTYDSHGNLTSITTPAPNSNTAASITQFGYNSLGELTTITDPLNHVTTLTYATAGLVATITDAQNHVTTYGYDAHGNRTSVTDANNKTTTFTYDAGDRLKTITYPDNSTTSFTYDDRGRRTSVTDQNSKTTSYAYDDADRLTSVTNAANRATTYAYDTEDNLTSITDANSNSTAFTYDAFGRATKANFPNSHSETYLYDANNNLTSKTDRNGNTITYTYDDLNRLTSKTYADTTSVTYTFDLTSKVLQLTDPTGTYSFTYDNMGRLTGATTSYTFLTSRNFTASYAYDAESNLTGFTDPENGSTGYTYDTLNRLTALAPPSAFGSGAFAFSYDVLSRRTQMTRPNNVTTNYAYDNLSRLLTVLHQVGSSTIDGAGYGLDTAGNRTSKTDYLANVTSNYTYDAIYELTQVTQGTNTTESYSYDPVHNRLSSLGVASYTVNNSNELTSNSNATYTYDNNGNTLTKTDSTGTTTYAWDFENRLTSVTLPGSGGTVSFKYDPLGRRISKSSSQGTNIFAYSGSRLAETVNSSGAVVARYVYGIGIDEALAVLQSGTTNYYEADGLGSVTSLTSSAGAVAQTYTYDSFGKQTASSGSLSNPLRYTAREFDAETNLYYNRARYYDPSTGRFLNEDPIRFSGGINLYGYTRNSPANYGDPFGLCPPPNNTPCPLVGPIGQYTTATGVIPLFDPATAQALSQALSDLNSQGIVPVMTSGYRSPGKQAALAATNSPAVVTPAQVSWHNAGSAVDFGPNSNAGNFGAIQASMAQAGFVWGGSFSTPDTNHFQSQPAGTSPTDAMVQACAAVAGGQ